MPTLLDDPDEVRKQISCYLGCGVKRQLEQLVSLRKNRGTHPAESCTLSDLLREAIGKCLPEWLQELESLREMD